MADPTSHDPLAPDGAGAARAQESSHAGEVAELFRKYNRSLVSLLAARRLQTFLFKVDLTAQNPISEYLFYPNAGCTYWLGDLSPDNKHVALFELDHDDRKVRAGVWSFESNKVRWFAPRPDEGKLEDATAWISNDELIYPAKNAKFRMVQASALTGEIQPCAQCAPLMLRQMQQDAKTGAAHVHHVAAGIEAKDLPQGAELITGAANGSLAIYAMDNKEVLSLLYKQPDQPAQVLFENKRKWQAR